MAALDKLLYSEKKGKMRYYYPLIKKHDYLEFVTNEFMEKYHGGSFTSFFATLFDLRMVSDETLDSFVAWVKQHRQEFRRYNPFTSAEQTSPPTTLSL